MIKELKGRELKTESKDWSRMFTNTPRVLPHYVHSVARVGICGFI